MKLLSVGPSLTFPIEKELEETGKANLSQSPKPTNSSSIFVQPTYSPCFCTPVLKCSNGKSLTFHQVSTIVKGPFVNADLVGLPNRKV